MSDLGSTAQRPMGHPRVFKTLAHSVLSDTVHHAYLFEGITGIGKGETAMWFARGLLCADRRDPSNDRSGAHGAAADELGCGQCAACASLGRGQHPDLLEVAPPEDSKQIRVEQVRELIQRVRYAPLRGGSRVILIKGADLLGEVPANALLKTLEEPAPYNIFLLLTHRPESLLPTILSRCQRVRFAPLPLQLVVKALTDDGLEAAPSQILAMAAGGSPGMARMLRDAGFLETASYWLDRYLNPGTSKAADPREAITDAAELARAFRKNSDPTTSGVALLLTAIRLGLRDIILTASGTGPSLLTWPERARLTVKLGEKVPLGRLLGLMDSIQEAEQLFLRPLNPTLVVEDTLMRVVTAIR